eukprot:3230776-Alexandrium_andersonii.AAC.1
MLGTRVAVRSGPACSAHESCVPSTHAEHARFALRADHLRADRVPRTIPSPPCVLAACWALRAARARARKRTRSARDAGACLGCILKLRAEHASGESCVP